MIFLDSSFIIAYANEQDSLHDKALSIATDLDNGKYGTPVITDYVFDEVITTILVRTKNLKKVMEIGEKLLDTTLMLRIDVNLFDETWRNFKDQKEAKLSFTDCSIIVACKANGIATLATFDSDLKKLSKLSVID
ncbi:MAG: PIN domain-containing protein [Candidatus Micrarchaeaceae archaeon]|jgi:predicted nucleic acid-binding protein